MNEKQYVKIEILEKISDTQKSLKTLYESKGRFGTAQDLFNQLPKIQEAHKTHPDRIETGFCLSKDDIISVKTRLTKMSDWDKTEFSDVQDYFRKSGNTCLAAIITIY